jgi:predicted HTH transcriptional regulator
MNLRDLKKIVSQGEDSQQDWPKIQFNDDRDACIFLSTVERAPGPFKGAFKGAFKGENAPLNAPLSKLQTSILELIKENSRISLEELADKLDKDRSTIIRNIQQLKASQMLSKSA